MLSWPSLHRSPQRLHAWFAILAIMLNALMPIAAQAHAAASPRTVGAVALCSAAGMKKITLPTTEFPGEPAHPLQHAHCPVCAAGGAPVLPAINPQLFFAALQAIAPPFFDRPVPLTSTFSRPASRAPRSQLD